MKLKTVKHGFDVLKVSCMIVKKDKVYLQKWCCVVLSDHLILYESRELLSLCSRVSLHDCFILKVCEAPPCHRFDDNFYVLNQPIILVDHRYVGACAIICWTK